MTWLLGVPCCCWPFGFVSATTAFAQDRNDRRMDIINDTDRVVNSVYATNSTIKNWGRDLLGQDVIPSKQSYRFDFNDGTGQCMFDLRAVLDNGRFFERYRVNVCTASPGASQGRAPRPSKPRPANRRGKGRPQARRSRVPTTPLRRPRRKRPIYEQGDARPAGTLWPREHGFSFVAASVNTFVLTLLL